MRFRLPLAWLSLAPCFWRDLGGGNVFDLLAFLLFTPMEVDDPF